MNMIFRLCKKQKIAILGYSLLEWGLEFTAIILTKKTPEILVLTLNFQCLFKRKLNLTQESAKNQRAAAKIRTILD